MEKAELKYNNLKDKVKFKGNSRVEDLVFEFKA